MPAASLGVGGPDRRDGAIGGGGRGGITPDEPAPRHFRGLAQAAQARGPSLVTARRRTIRQGIYFSRDQLMPLGGRAGDVTRSLAGVFVGGSTAFPRGIIGTGATPRGRCEVCENPHRPTPLPRASTGGSLPYRSARLVRPRRPGSTRRNRNNRKGIVRHASVNRDRGHL